MGKKRYGVKLTTKKIKQEEISLFDKIPFGIILSAILMIIWSFLQIVKVWFNIELVNSLLTFVYLLGIFSGCTIIIDYLFHKKR